MVMRCGSVSARQRQRLHHRQSLRPNQHLPPVRAVHENPGKRRQAETSESVRRNSPFPAAARIRSAGRPATRSRSASSTSRPAKWSARQRTAGSSCAATPATRANSREPPPARCPRSACWGRISVFFGGHLQQSRQESSLFLRLPSLARLSLAFRLNVSSGIPAIARAPASPPQRCRWGDHCS